MSMSDVKDDEYRDILGYNGLYGISRTGVIVSFQGLKPRVLKHNRAKDGYGHHSVVLSRDGAIHRYSVAKLMAEAYIPNPDNYNYVRFVDGDPDNLSVENLRWDIKDNSKAVAASHTKEALAKISLAHKKSGFMPQTVVRRKVGAYDGNGNLLATFRSIADAERMIGRKNIGQALKIGCRSGGYYWKYEDKT